jgi:hypothetical protein
MEAEKTYSGTSAGIRCTDRTIQSREGMMRGSAARLDTYFLCLLGFAHRIPVALKALSKRAWGDVVPIRVENGE